MVRPRYAQKLVTPDQASPTSAHISNWADRGPKNMNIRVWSSPVVKNMVEGLGFQATTMAWGDIFPALQSGIVDGAICCTKSATYSIFAQSDVGSYYVQYNSVSELTSYYASEKTWANPFVNSGAIVTTDALLSGSAPKETLAEILQFVRIASSDNEIFIDAAVAKSENETGHRNRALAHILTASGNLSHPVDLTLGTYFHHCAIAMNCKQLARFGRFLAGVHPLGTLISAQQVRSINALMMTSGHYNGSGEFAFRVGVPAKSGVGGGILAIVPGVASIAVWSPGLNNFGNSLLGTRALELLCAELDWSVFSSIKKPKFD